MSNQLKLDFTKLKVVDINSIRPNEWNPKDRDTKEYQDVKRSIQVNGLKGFIVVREKTVDDCLYEIIDGEQRWTACKELGFTKIVIYNEGIVADKFAKELTLWWQVQVPFNETSLAKLVTNIVNEYGGIDTFYSTEELDHFREVTKFVEDFSSLSTKPPQMGDNEVLQSFMVQMTTEQYDMLQQALQKVKDIADEEGLDISDGRALELMCAEYITSA